MTPQERTQALIVLLGQAKFELKMDEASSWRERLLIRKIWRDGEVVDWKFSPLELTIVEGGQHGEEGWTPIWAAKFAYSGSFDQT